MSDQEVITLDSDDEGEAADLIVGPTGTAVPIHEAVKHGLQRLPLPPGMMASNPQSMNRNVRKIPKKPGVFPPFALFSQEHRETLLSENKDISFAEVGKKLGEMWHALTEEEKESYRQRARDIGEQKLREYNEKMRALQQPGRVNPAMAGGIGPRRRKTHGYAIFSSEMRKKIADNTPMTEASKIIAAEWRSASAEVHQEYEARAAKINEAEERRFQALVLQTRRRQQMQQQQQQRNQLLQQQQQRNELLQQQQQQFRNMSRVGGIRQQPSSTGLRISSVSSLSAGRSRPIPPSVNLPSSITISRVEPEISIVAEQPAIGIDTSKIPPGLSIQRMRGPPPLMRGGIRSGVQPMRIGRTNIQRVPLQQQQQLPLAHRVATTPAYRSIRPMPNVVSARTFQMQQQQRNLSGQGFPIKRPMRGGFVGGTPVKQPRIAMPLPASPSQRRPMRPAAGSGPVNTLLCRFCAQLSSFCFPLKDKPEILESVRFVLGVDIDLDEDMEKGYPQFVCRKCATVISTYSDYKKVFEAAQIKLKMMKESEDRVSTTRIVSDTDDSILPDLDCEVDLGENHPMIPQPLSIKQEKISTILSNSIESAEKLAEEQKLKSGMNFKIEEVKTEASHSSLENNLPEDKVAEEQQLVDGSAALDDDNVQDGEDGVDPLMFIQVGQVESNYADFDKEAETEENQNEAWNGHGEEVNHVDEENHPLHEEEPDDVNHKEESGADDQAEVEEQDLESATKNVPEEEAILEEENQPAPDEPDQGEELADQGEEGVDQDENGDDQGEEEPVDNDGKGNDYGVDEEVFEHSLESFHDEQSESNDAHQNGDNEGIDAVVDDDVSRGVNGDGDEDYGLEKEAEPTPEDLEPVEEGDGELQQDV